MIEPLARRQRIRLEDLYPKQDGICRCGCGATLTGRRRVWASNECSAKAVEDYLVRKGDQDAIQGAVFKRDKGVCQDCRMDTERERELCLAWDPPPGIQDPARWSLEVAELRLRRQQQGFPSPARRRWWDADHVIPVALGGGGCGVDGYATRCIRCHRRKTADQASDAALQRRLQTEERRRLLRERRVAHT